MLITKDDSAAGDKPASRTGQGAASLIPHLNNDSPQVISPNEDGVDVSTPAAPPQKGEPEEPAA